MLAVYLCVCQHCGHLTRRRRAGRCADRLPVCLFNIVITSRGEEEAGSCAGVYLCVCQHCDHLTWRRRSWSLCWPSTCMSVNIVITSRGEEGADRCAGLLPVCVSTL